MDIERVITIEEDGDKATYVRRGGGERDGRVLETKSVDLAALVPDEGGLHALPPKCRFTDTHEGLSVFVIEDAPTSRMVRWITAHANYLPMKERLLQCGAHHALHEDVTTFDNRLRTQEFFRLAFPYIVKAYLFAGDVLQSVSLWYRVKPLIAESDGLLEPNLPNRYTSWSREPHRHAELCLSPIAKQTNGGSFAEMINFVEADFWGSAWTQDLTEDFFADASRIPEVASPWEWERSSAANSQFPLHAPWRSADCTIGDVIRNLLKKSDATPQIFTLFANRVQRADPIDVRRAGTAGGVKASTTNLIEVTDAKGHTVLRAGDVLVCTHALFSELAVGARSIIEWFGRDSGDSDRLVKLTGLDDPLPLVVGGKLLAGFARDAGATEEVIEVGGTRLEAGTIVEIQNHEEWPDRPRRYYVVASSRRGVSGELLAKFVKEGFYTVLGTGEKLFAGIRLLPREACDHEGYLVAHTFRLIDGTDLKIGDRLFVMIGGTITEVMIHRFRALESNGEGHRFFATNGRYYGFEAMDGTLAQSFVRAPQSPLRVARLGKQFLRRGDLIMVDGGGPHEVQAFSPRFVNGSQWVNVSHTWILLLKSDGVAMQNIRAVPKITFSAHGLDCGGEHYPVGAHINDGTRSCRTIDHFVKVGSADVDIEADGFQTAFIRNGERVKNVTVVSYRAQWRKHMTLVRGMRIRLREDVPHEKRGKRFLISHFVTSPDEKYVMLVTACGRAFDLVAANAQVFEMRRHNVWVPLVSAEEKIPIHVPKGVELVRFEGLRTLRAPRESSRVPTDRLVKPGYAIASDNTGSIIKVGDRVRVTDVSGLDTGTTTPLGERLVRGGHVFTVVHYGKQFGVAWLYLDAGEVVFSERRTNRVEVGAENIPMRLLQDPTWWARLIFARANRCRVVE